MPLLGGAEAAQSWPTVRRAQRCPVRPVRDYSAANSGRAYDSRNPQAEQRKTPTGTHLSGETILTCRNSQPTFSGAPSTQVLTIRLGPSCLFG